jgi:hypothetical protein
MWPTCGPLPQTSQTLDIIHLTDTKTEREPPKPGLKPSENLDFQLFYGKNEPRSIQAVNHKATAKVDVG